MPCHVKNGSKCDLNLFLFQLALDLLVLIAFETIFCRLLLPSVKTPLKSGKIHVLDLQICRSAVI